MEKSREDLRTSQIALINSRMDPHLIENIKALTEQFITYQETEEKVFINKSKIEWLRKVDCNNYYFFATVKTKQNTRSLQMLQKPDGTSINQPHDIKRR